MLPGEPESKHGPFKTNQVISRTVRDSAALFHETQDRNGPFEPVPPISRSSDRRPLRIGLAIDIEGAIPTETPVRDAQLSTASLLEELGHSVEEVRYPVDAEEFFEAHTNAFLRQFLVVAEAAESLSGFPAADSGLLDPFTASILTYAASISDEEAEAGMAFLDALPHKFAAAFEEVDLILSPVTPVASIAADALRPDQYFTNESRKFLEDRMSFCAPVNVVGNCAMSIPLNSARDTGLPVGSMLQAATGNDRLLYECALELEDARPWKDRWAPYSIRYIPV